MRPICLAESWLPLVTRHGVRAALLSVTRRISRVEMKQQLMRMEDTRRPDPATPAYALPPKTVLRQELKQEEARILSPG